MKTLLKKIFVVATGILILCFVFKYFFKYDLWNLFMIPLFNFLFNIIKNIFKFIIDLFN